MFKTNSRTFHSKELERVIKQVSVSRRVNKEEKLVKYKIETIGQSKSCHLREGKQPLASQTPLLGTGLKVHTSQTLVQLQDQEFTPPKSHPAH